jgi:hypothetical protein
MAEYTKVKFLQDPKKKMPVLRLTAVLESLLVQTPSPWPLLVQPVARGASEYSNHHNG